MKREVNKRRLLNIGVVIFDLIGLIGCALISWKAALWYFGFAFIGAMLQYASKKMEDELPISEPTVPVEPQPTKEEVVEVTKVHTRPVKKSIKKAKKSIVKE